MQTNNIQRPNASPEYFKALGARADRHRAKVIAKKQQRSMNYGVVEVDFSENSTGHRNCPR